MSQYATEETAAEIAIFIKDHIGKYGNDERGREHWTIAVQFALDDYAKREGWPNAEVLPKPNREDPCDGKKYPFLLDFVLWRRDLAERKRGSLDCL